MSLHVDGLTVRYPGRPGRALDDVSFDVPDGEWLGVTGRTGAGKSTLALAASGLLPRVIHASIGGRVTLDDLELTTATAADVIGRCGAVFASPAEQLSGSKPTVREELAFGLENLGIERAAMDGRIDEALQALGIARLADRDPGTLSGGEQQRVAIASIAVMGPGLLVLDEPTAELDPAGTRAVIDLLGHLRARGTTILCAEHDPAVLDAGDRRIVLDAGRVVDHPPDPPPLGPLTWDVGSPLRGVAVSLDHVAFRYPNGVQALRDVSLEVEPGETVAIVGPNGSGKTTLAKHINGLLRPTTGRVHLGGTATVGVPVNRLAALCGFAFQDPGDQLFERSVEREVGFGARRLGRSEADATRLVEAALTVTGLGDDRAANPYDLDRSRRKLVTLAGVLAMDPAVLVLDEPTTGQDPEGVERVGRIVEAMKAAGRTVIAITHDEVFAERWFDWVVVMASGRVASDHPARGA
jgi:energy-coupling factor transporter ATP-binding protein EcfA2